MELPCTYCGTLFTQKYAAQRLCSHRCNARERAAKGTLSPQRKKLPPATELSALYLSGLSCSDIGKRYGAHPTSVRSALQRAGIERRPSWVDAAIKNTGKRGPAHMAFKGERKINGEGYVVVYEPTHPRANTQGLVLEHRLVMERQLGRLLTRREHVHHINEIRTDNCPENLMLVDAAEHTRLHDQLGKFRTNNPPVVTREMARQAGLKGAATRWGKKP